MLTFTEETPIGQESKLRKIVISSDMTAIPFLETNKLRVSCKNRGKIDEELLREHVSHLISLGYETKSRNIIRRRETKVRRDNGRGKE
jgi:hypothetical protein